MNDVKTVKVEHEKQGFKQRFADLLEDMWEKIGKQHHGISGPVPQDITADLTDAEDTFTYSLELPGMDENDVEVVIESGRLVIRGEKRDEREEKGENYVFRERTFGSIQRSFKLPANVREEAIAASFKMGVLTVKVPYSTAKEQAPKKIEVSSG